MRAQVKHAPGGILTAAEAAFAKKGSRLRASTISGNAWATQRGLSPPQAPRQCVSAARNLVPADRCDALHLCRDRRDIFAATVAPAFVCGRMFELLGRDQLRSFRTEVMTSARRSLEINHPIAAAGRAGRQDGAAAGARDPRNGVCG
jgi:hypothetical protein